MKTLFELLHEANAVEIDRVLCANFFVESEEIEDDEIVFDISYEESGNTYEYAMTLKELSKAKQNEDGSWYVPAINCTLKPYKLVALNA